MAIFNSYVSLPEGIYPGQGSAVLCSPERSGSWFLEPHRASRYSMIFHDIPSFSMIFHDIPSFSMIFHHFPWYSIIFHHFPWYSIIFHHFPWYSMIFPFLLRGYPSCVLLSGPIPSSQRFRQLRTFHLFSQERLVGTVDVLAATGYVLRRALEKTGKPYIWW